jgi:hypothetical protein
MLQRMFFLSALLCAPSLAAQDKLDRSTAKVEKDVAWYDIRPLGVEGQGWKETKAPFDRLPAKAERVVRAPVWGLSQDSAGLCVRFVTDATTLSARWKLTKKSLAMPHMPATGVSGLDLYIREGKAGWLWLANGRPNAQTNTAALASGLGMGKREFLLYLPLYNGVSSVEIGIPEAATLCKAPPRSADRRKPIVFYGTSITQGGCASRPGMVHTAIIGRRLDCPIINLGFSGNGRMEPEVTKLIAEIDAAAYVIDCLPNMNGKDVEDRTEPLVQTLRKARSETPIVLVEDRSYANAHTLSGPKKHNADNRAALKKAFERLEKGGVKKLHYLPGGMLLGDDSEGTVDSSHPTDLGFLRQAEAFLKVLAPLLPRPDGN